MVALWLSLHTNTTILQGKFICQIVCFLNQGTIIKSDSSVASFTFSSTTEKETPHQKAIFPLILFNKITFYYFPRCRRSARCPRSPRILYPPPPPWGLGHRVVVSGRSVLAADPGGRTNKCKINSGKIKMNGIRMTPRYAVRSCGTTLTKMAATTVASSVVAIFHDLLENELVGFLAANTGR